LKKDLSGIQIENVNVSKTSYLCAKTLNMNHLILGDNLEVLKRLNSESVDLIYLDPPFFSNRNYEVIWGDAGEIRSFQDRWLGGIPHYIDWLKERVREMHRILKPTGSIFLHCDWHADAHIRVLILEPIFGYQNFRNHITWQRTNSHNDAKRKMPNVCDSIFYYSKSDNFVYHPQYTPHSEEYKQDFYRHDDKDGRGLYRLDNMSAPAGGGMSAINKLTGKPNGWYVYKGFQPPEKGWRYSFETMSKLDDEGKIYFPKSKDGNFDYTKRLCLKRFLKEQNGILLSDIWTDTNNVQSQSKERIGYPTQKPEKLLERIIEMASNEGDVVLDPFVGGGTTVAVADRLKRQWIGIDQSVQAVKVTEMRLMQQRDLFSQPFETQLLKYDFETLRFGNAFEFETFIVTQFGGTPNVKQRGDLGIDGKAADNTPIQVKRSDGIGRNVVDNFQSAITRYDKRLYEKNKAEERPVGYLIAFSFGKGAFEEVARLKNVDNVIIKLVKVSEIVPMAERAKLQVTHSILSTDKKGLHNVQIVATAQSDCEIQFYSWDMDYKADLGFRPSILLDKKGEQTVSLKTGTHPIAVKVVNENGLEAMEIVRLSV
jgi:DNA modification methylase